MCTSLPQPQLLMYCSCQLRSVQVRVWKGLVQGLPTVFLEPENGHFWRGCIYGRGDDAVR